MSDDWDWPDDDDEPRPDFTYGALRDPAKEREQRERERREQHERELATIPGILDLRGDITAIAGFHEYTEQRKRDIALGRGHELDDVVREIEARPESLINWWRAELERRNHETRRRWELRREREAELVKLCGRHARVIIEGRLDSEAFAIIAIKAWSGDTSSGHKSIALLHGPPGRGKTQAAAYWCWLWATDTRRHVALPQWISATDLAESSYARTARFDDARAKRLSERRAELLETTPKLVIDDLGMEDDTKPVRANIDAVVDRYYTRGAWLLITTNLTRDGIHKRYRERIADRLREVGKYIAVTGPNRRSGDEA